MSLDRACVRHRRPSGSAEAAPAVPRRPAALLSRARHETASPAHVAADLLASDQHGLGVTHVAIDLAGLEAGGDPFEASVARLWRSLVAEECDPPLVREGGYALYALRTEMGPTALAAAGGGRRHA